LDGVLVTVRVNGCVVPLTETSLGVVDRAVLGFAIMAMGVGFDVRESMVVEEG
jgi:hypothetical protein